MYSILSAKEIPYGVSPYASLDYCLQALQAGGTCIFRPGNPDCPNRIYDVDPVQSALQFMTYAKPYADELKGYSNVWLEPLNECLQTPLTVAQLQWWADWMNTYIDKAAELGWPPLALPTLPPGSGDGLLFSVWKDALLNLKTHDGVFSTHDYTFNSQANLCPYDKWESYRHVLQHEWMVYYGYDVPIAITEAARQSGNAVPDVQDFICWVNNNRLEYVHSIWLWVGGYNGTWPKANLDGYYIPIAEGIH